MVALLVGGGSGRASLLEGQQERGCLFLAECAASAVFSIPLRTGHGRACGGKEILEHLRVVRCERHARCLPDRRRGAGSSPSTDRSPAMAFHITSASRTAANDEEAVVLRPHFVPAPFGDGVPEHGPLSRQCLPV